MTPMPSGTNFRVELGLIPIDGGCRRRQP